MTCRRVILCCIVFWTGCYESESETDQGTMRPSRWDLVFEENFYDDAWRSRWLLEGVAEMERSTVDGSRVLAIHTQVDSNMTKNRQSVLWCRQQFCGNLRIVFRIKGETGNRSIFYFNAQPT
jgi:hypothetical protein